MPRHAQLFYELSLLPAGEDDQQQQQQQLVYVSEQLGRATTRAVGCRRVIVGGNDSRMQRGRKS
jgi:hypothetical protein